MPGALSEGGERVWSEDRIYLIYGSGPFLMAALGLLTLFFQRKMKRTGWRTRLMLTWTAFLLISTLPCGILAGTFFYEGFGVFLSWFVPGSIARMVIAVLAMGSMLFFSRAWHRLFLNASYTTTFLNTGEDQRTYLLNVFLKPWIFGYFALLLYAWPFSGLYWRAFLLALGWLALPLIDRTLPMQPHLQIRKTERKNIFGTTRIILTLLFLAGLWLAGNMAFDI